MVIHRTDEELFDMARNSIPGSNNQHCAIEDLIARVQELREAISDIQERITYLIKKYERITEHGNWSSYDVRSE